MKSCETTHRGACNTLRDPSCSSETCKMPLRFVKSSLTGAGKFSLILLLASFVSTKAFIQKTQQRSESCQFENNDNGVDKAQKIMYNQQSRKREGMRYQIIAAEACEPLAQRMTEVGLDFVLIWALIGPTKKTLTSLSIFYYRNTQTGLLSIPRSGRNSRMARTTLI